MRYLQKAAREDAAVTFESRHRGDKPARRPEPRQGSGRGATVGDERRLGGSQWHGTRGPRREEEGVGASQITELIRAYQGGEKDAFDRVVPLVYDELRRLARRHLRRGPRGHTLDTTGLVHEAYMKLAGADGLKLKDRGHLLAVSARAMRQVLVDHARARLRQKRGAGQPALGTLDD